MAFRHADSSTAPPSFSFTVDLEDHFEFYDYRSRYPAITYKIIDELARLGTRATFFVVGRIAEHHPELVRAVADAGHEIACHGYQHTQLDRTTPSDARAEWAKAKTILEQVSGAPVLGFRAPTFSLTRTTLWAVEVLADVGFTYSSSVLPAANPLYGMPDAPTAPFRWWNGLPELPCPLLKVGPASVPYLGGIYLRYLPSRLVDWAATRAGRETLLWTYCHPYDFDADEKFAPIPNNALWASCLLWLNRKGTFRKIERLLKRFDSMPMSTWVERHGSSLPVSDIRTGWAA